MPEHCACGLDSAPGFPSGAGDVDVDTMVDRFMAGQRQGTLFKLATNVDRDGDGFGDSQTTVSPDDDCSDDGEPDRQDGAGTTPDGHKGRKP